SEIWLLPQHEPIITQNYEHCSKSITNDSSKKFSPSSQTLSMPSWAYWLSCYAHCVFKTILRGLQTVILTYPTDHSINSTGGVNLWLATEDTCSSRKVGDWTSLIGQKERQPKIHVQCSSRKAGDWTSLIGQKERLGILRQIGSAKLGCMAYLRLHGPTLIEWKRCCPIPLAVYNVNLQTLSKCFYIHQRPNMTELVYKMKIHDQ
ncbi:unnamed protein product, partial [Owenia fusiformis]